MTSAAQWHAYSLAGFLALASELAWMVLSPLYEVGASALITPLLCLLGVAIFYFYLRKSRWAYQWSLPYAIGNGTIMGIFIGESSAFYGKYTAVMNVVEAGVLLSSIAVLVVYFLPGIRSHFGAAAN